MDLTKDDLTILRHGLDVMCRNEGASLGQVGLNGLKEGRAGMLSSRLLNAANLDERLNAEFARLDEIEKAAAAAAEAEAADKAKAKE